MKPWGVLILLLCLAACGDPPTAQESARDLIGRLAGGLPAGWKVGLAAEAGPPLPEGAVADDIVVWRPGPVPVQRRPGQAEAASAQLTFVLRVGPWIDPADFPTRRQAWQAAMQARAAADARIAQIPRSLRDEPMPRSELEVRAVEEWRRAIAALPAPEALPSHHSGRIGLRPLDSRARQVPEDRALQREQNLVYGRIIQALTPYPDAP